MRVVNENELVIVHEKLLELLVAFRDICEKEKIFYSLCAGTMLGAIRHNGFIPWDTDADVMIWLPDIEKFREAFEKNKPTGIYLKNHDMDPKCMQSHDTMYFEDAQIVEDIHLDIFPLVGAPSDYDEQKKFARYTYFMDKIVRSKYKKIKNCQKKNKLFVTIVKIIEFFIPDKVLKNNIKNRKYMYDFKSSECVIMLSNYGRAEECMPKRIWEQMVDYKFENTYFKVPSKWDEYLTRMYGDYMTPKKY